MFDSLKRHIGHAAESLAEAKADARSKHDLDNTEFLPAALEVLETPPNPLGRWMLWVILSFLILALTWSIIGSVDVVSTGEGRIIPRGQVKVVQSADIGVVRELPVRDGQFVKAGDPLVVLDPTVSGAEVEQAKQALLSSEIDLNRAKALADFAAGRPFRFSAPEGVDPSLVAVQEAYLKQRVDEQTSTLASLSQEKAQRTQDMNMAQQEGIKLAQQLPLVEEHLNDLETLSRKGYAPRAMVSEVKEKAIGMRQDIFIHTQDQHKSEAALLSATQAYQTQKSKFAGEALDAFTKAAADYRQRTEELKKAEEKSRLTILRAPIDGYAQQLQLHTLGGVVKPADSLMIIVPKNVELMIEAQFSNREIGFLHEGQPVEIKLEAFPFTRYGTLHGHLEHINQDSVNDDKRGLLYTAMVVIDMQSKDAMSNTHDTNPGQHLNGSLGHTTGKLNASWLRPGMSATVEVKTGRRRIISYLLSPLARRVTEAGRER